MLHCARDSFHVETKNRNIVSASWLYLWTEGLWSIVFKYFTRILFICKSIEQGDNVAISENWWMVTEEIISEIDLIKEKQKSSSLARIINNLYHEWSVILSIQGKKCTLISHLCWSGYNNLVLTLLFLCNLRFCINEIPCSGTSLAFPPNSILDLLWAKVLIAWWDFYEFSFIRRFWMQMRLIQVFIFKANTWQI